MNINKNEKFFKKTTQIKLILEIKKGSLKKMILENLNLKEKRANWLYEQSKYLIKTFK